MVSRALINTRYRGARITRDAVDNIQSGVVTNVRHYLVLRDTDSFFNSAAQYQGCFFIPANVRRVRLSASIQWDTPGVAGERWQDIIHNNGTVVKQVACDRRYAVTSSESTIFSPVLDVAQGDIVTHRAYQSTGAPLQYLYPAGLLWFDLEVID